MIGGETNAPAGLLVPDGVTDHRERRRSLKGGLHLVGICSSVFAGASRRVFNVTRAGASVVILAALVATSGVQPLRAQSSHDLYRISAVRVDEPPRLDGRMDESVWGTAAVVEDFVQQEPNEGAPASERTEVRVLYEGSFLYVGVRAFDSQPDQVIATEMRRDSDRILDEDNFQIVLDTFNDHRSAYMFVTTPLGAKLEQQVFEEGEGGSRRGFGIATNINRDWDGVWHVATQQTSDGWTAEIAIPMVTLRFPNAQSQEWGINFMRNIRRKNEQAFWAGIPKPYTLTRVSLAGSLTDLESLSRGMDLRVKPFVAGGAEQTLMRGPVEDTEGSREREIGLDVKYGVTAGLNLDLTLNTDFAQAEVDDEQVNLTRFALFFPEKREFFLENAGQFNVGTNSSFQRVADLFFSRRIGLSETGDAVPIIGGARLSGKVGRNNIAIMDIQTDNLLGVDNVNRRGENFFVARYSRDILSRSKIGALVINKELSGDDYYNRTFAADMTPCTPSELLGQQLHRQDVDTRSVWRRHGRLPAGGMAGRVVERVRGVPGPPGQLQPRGRIPSSHGDPHEQGARRVQSPTRAVRHSRVGAHGQRHLHDGPEQSPGHPSNPHMLGTRLDNGSYINIWYNRNLEVLDEPFEVRPDVMVGPGTHRFGDWRFMYTSDPARKVYGSGYYSPQTFFDGDRDDYNATVGLRLTSQLATEGAITRNDVTLPGGSFTAVIASFRLDYALSPTMTLRTLTQYNSLIDQWSTAARFNYIYRPGSDIYIVYDELRRDLPTSALSEFTSIRERQLIVKVTYLFSR